MMILLRYSLKQAQESYNYRYSPYCATLKPKDFPYRAGPCRPLDNFELLKSALGMGRFWITRKTRSSFSTPIVASQ
jgi:hypothetical protein